MVGFITGDLLKEPRRVGKPWQRELEGRWAARRGSYRVLYTIDEQAGVVTILAAEHRRDVYRGAERGPGRRLGGVSTELRRRTWTVDDYHRMGEAGVLGEDDRVELIEGEIIEMSPIRTRHARAVNVLAHLLHQQVGERAIVSVQNPIRLSERSEPQPDLALLRWRDDFYPVLPSADDVHLVIEVADSSLAFDRSVKLPLYAAGGITEAWLVDLVGGVVEVHLDPSRSGYARQSIHGPGEVITAVAISDVAVPVAEIVGAP